MDNYIAIYFQNTWKEGGTMEANQCLKTFTKWERCRAVYKESLPTEKIKSSCKLLKTLFWSHIIIPSHQQDSKGKASENPLLSFPVCELAHEPQFAAEFQPNWFFLWWHIWLKFNYIKLYNIFLISIIKIYTFTLHPASYNFLQRKV